MTPDAFDPVAMGIPASLVLIALATGLSVRHEELRAMRLQWPLLIRSLVTVHLIAPMLAVVLASTLPLDPIVKVAILALAISPLPSFLPPNGHVTGAGRLASPLLAVSTLVSVLTVPATLSVYGDVFGLPFSPPPVALTARLLLTGLLPLFVGLQLARVAPALGARWSGRVGAAGAIVLALSVVPAVVSQWPMIQSLAGAGAALVMVSYATTTLLIGHLLGGPVQESRVVLAQYATARHPAIAFGVVQASFPQEPSAGSAVLLLALVTTAATLPYLLLTRRARSSSGSTRTLAAPPAQRPRS